MNTQAQITFAVRHYAGLVSYNCHGFLEKNGDKVLDDQRDVIRASRSPHVRSIVDEDAGVPDEVLVLRRNGSAVGGQGIVRLGDAASGAPPLQRAGSSAVGGQRIKTIGALFISSTLHIYWQL